MAAQSHNGHEIPIEPERLSPIKEDQDQFRTPQQPNQDLPPVQGEQNPQPLLMQPVQPIQPPLPPKNENIPFKEKAINKPTPFDGNRKKITTFIQECQMYLQINRKIYDTDEDKVAFMLSFMTEKEALKWKQTYLQSITNWEGEIQFPTIKKFIEYLNIYFKPTNQTRDAAHQLKMLKQGKRTAEEVIMEFRLLISEAGYSSSTPSDNLHLIEKLQDALNPSLTRKILLSEKVPTTIEDWALKAIDIDSNYRSALDILGRYTSRTTSSPTKTVPNRQRREERDPNAMDVDAMTTEERDSLMKKGACFICKKTGHRARDCEERKSNGKKHANSPNLSNNNLPKPWNIRKIHAVLQGLSKEEKEELLALQQGEMKEEDEDF